MLPSQAYAGESCHTVPRLSQTFDMWDYQSVPRPPQQFASAICQPAPVIKNTLAGTESQIEEAKRKNAVGETCMRCCRKAFTDC